MAFLRRQSVTALQRKLELAPQRGLRSPRRPAHPANTSPSSPVRLRGPENKATAAGRAENGPTAGPLFWLEFLLQSAGLPAGGAKHLTGVEFVPGKEQDVVVTAELCFLQRRQVQAGEVGGQRGRAALNRPGIVHAGRPT